MTVTADNRERIAEFLAEHELAPGNPSTARPCSLSAINLALHGALSTRLDCAPLMIQWWVTTVQDQMPEAMMSRETEHGQRWRALLPLVAGSINPALDSQRADAVLDWMWTCLGREDVIAIVPDGARSRWLDMIRDRSTADAHDARAIYDADTEDAVHAIYTTYAIGAAAEAVAHASAAMATASGDDRDRALGLAAKAAACAVCSAADAVGAFADGRPSIWLDFDPAGLLAQLVGSQS